MDGCVLFLDSESAKMVYFDSVLGMKSKDFTAGTESRFSYYDTLAENMATASELVLVGPDQEKGQFHKWINLNDRKLGKKLVAVLPAASLSFEFANTIRNKYFR